MPSVLPVWLVLFCASVTVGGDACHLFQDPEERASGAEPCGVRDPGERHACVDELFRPFDLQRVDVGHCREAGAPFCGARDPGARDA